MIEDHYGHINPVKNAERILQGLPGWEPIAAAPQVVAETGRIHAETAKAQAVKSKATNKRPYSKSSREKGKSDASSLDAPIRRLYPHPCAAGALGWVPWTSWLMLATACRLPSKNRQTVR
jgi:hypothetical protein